jgi:carbonic anhydrase
MKTLWNLASSATLLAALVISAGCSSIPDHAAPAQTKESQAAITPTAALDRLKEGNWRFRTGNLLTRHFESQRKETAGGQYPFAIVLGCIDSRCAPEQVFDQGIGDIFSARIAGNVVNEDLLGSMEFACKVAGAKLITVLGHSKCGAVQGAANHVEMGNLTALLARIRPAVDATLPKDQTGKATPDQLAMITQANVERVVREIAERSPILAELQKSGKLKIVGGIYDLESGAVKFLE